MLSFLIFQDVSPWVPLWKKQNTKEALTGYLSSAFDKNLKIPDPSLLKGKTIYNIEPEHEVTVPILLRKLRETRKLTQGDIAVGNNQTGAKSSSVCRGVFGI